MEIILCDCCFAETCLCPYLLKSCFLFLLLQEIETIRPCVYVYTLHSDEVVSLLISGCEKFFIL